MVSTPLLDFLKSFLKQAGTLWDIDQKLKLRAQNGTVLSDQVNIVIDTCWHSNLPSPFRLNQKYASIVNDIAHLLEKRWLLQKNKVIQVLFSKEVAI